MKVSKGASTYAKWLILTCFIALSTFICVGIFTYFNNYQELDMEKNITSGAPTNSDLWTDNSSYYSQPSGSGTSSSPYLIANASNLAWISARYSSLNGRYFRQTANIDLSAHYWNPINNNGSSYSYHYDGNGYTISGLYIDASLLSSQRYIGLFGRITGTTSAYGYVQNLGLISGAITNGQYYIASIVGSATYINVTNCYNKGVTISEGSYIGGIVGNASNTEISNCYNSADIMSTGYGSYVGGIVAFFHVSCSFSTSGYSGVLETTLTKCYNLGNLSVPNCSYVGGMAGSLTYMVTTSGSASSQMLNMYITYCYNKGNITGSEQVGGIAGQVYNSSSCRISISSTYNTGSVSASYQYAGGVMGYSEYSSSNYLLSRYNYYNTTNTGVSRGLGGSGSGTTTDSSLYLYGRTLTQMTCSADGSRPSAFDSSHFSTSIWAFYKDCTPMLADVGEGINGPLRIDGSGTSSDPYIIDTAEKLAYISENYNNSTIYGHYFKQTANIDLSNYNPWTPINNTASHYAYYYDGGGHTISNLYINSSEQQLESNNYIGLFGCVYGSSSSPAYIKNLGIVNGNISGEKYVGAVVGQSYYTNISGCFNQNVIVTGTSSSVGGVVGENHVGEIANCYNTSNVTGQGNVGGIIGYNNGGVISNSYNSGTVTGSGSYTGGIVGYTNQLVSDCYNENVVSGNSWVGGITGRNEYRIANSYNNGEIVCTGNYVGGIAGDNYNGTIVYSYNNGKITGNDYVGGISGYNYSRGIISNCLNQSQINANDLVGGIAGYNGGRVECCANENSISGHNYIAGIVGNNFSVINNCYNTSTISGVDFAGGIVGYIQGTSTRISVISSCYNVGEVIISNTSSNCVGGIAGYIASSSNYLTQYVSVSWCYYDTQTSGNVVTSAIGVGNGYQCYGLTTTEMQGVQNENYMYLSSSFWNFASGQYPTLKYVVKA